ncbi:MAG: pyridoxal phosphate-dependent aminotransferase [Chloroflexi bacterium]|nr:pyridoxal phosphate-dependent aminotransferase [Chloroflexota bacterium]
MGISSKVTRQMREQSWIRQMFEIGLALKREYGEEKVFDLSLGNPILEPPAAFQQELRRLAEHPLPGMHRYMPNAGYPETRAAVAAQLSRETGLAFTASEVVITCGAGGALNVIFKSILDPGEEVIVFAPYFPEYVFYVDNHGGLPRIAPCDGSFQPDLNALERLLTPRTKAVLVNSPNNPTGAVYSAEVLKGLGEVLSRAESRFGRQVFLVSDEPYARLLYDGLTYPSIYPYHLSSIVATSYSKDLSLPGERIGYIAVNPSSPGHGELVDALTFSNRVLGFVNAPALMQHVVRALQGASVDMGWYQRRRDYLYKHLTALGFSMVKPQGAFYMFPRCPMSDDVAFVREMQKQNVLVVPGSGFGTPGYFRISYCVEERVLVGAMEGFARVAKTLGLAH